MRIRTSMTAAALALAAGAAAQTPGVEAPSAQLLAAPPSRQPIAFDLPATRAATDAPLQLSSPSFQANGVLPLALSAYGRNLSPALAWTAGPKATRAYVLIVQDPDANRPEPVVHWLAYDIPATALMLPPRMRNAAEPTNPLGMLQGENTHGSLGYSGPHPPIGDPPHHYHFQLFALDRRLRLDGGAQLPNVLRAMSGHVLARGELVGLYAQAAPKPRPPAGPGG